MRNIPALCAFLLCAALAAGTVGASLAAATMLKRKFTLDYDFSAFDPATATCADWEKIDLSHGPFAKAFILFQVDGYSAGRQGVDLAASVASITKDYGEPKLPWLELENACEAAPRQRLLPLWQEVMRGWRPWNADQTTCGDLLQLAVDGYRKSESSLLFLAWLHGYKRLSHEQPRTGIFNGDALRGVLTACAHHPDALVRDVLPPVPPDSATTADQSEKDDLDGVAARRSASQFDPALATCADWLQLDHAPPLRYGDSVDLDAEDAALVQVAGYANALDGMPLPGMLEFIDHKRDHLQNICTAQPRKRLLTLWRDLRPLSLQAGRTTCANWLALSENGDFLQNLLYILWLYGYNQANNGAPGSLLSRLEGFEHDLQLPLGDICSRRPEILLRDAVQRMSSP
ncbi:hypothetical protein [uncultured Desulfovibrio sp.]|uniref:hypothetical protein n=1 Tax=uncultured Desulfovibrio sp. TaxID=167968 RepID=UPI002672D18E|nr:hypothetical protein [uncultured Desulfovibrio sp.]